MSKKKELTKEEIENSNRPYYQIDKAKIFKGIQLCRLNAKSLFTSSTRIEDDNAELANSLMILSAEECVKCLVLFALYFDVPVPFEIKPIFSKHEAKHIQGKDLHGFIKTISVVFDLYSPKKSIRAKAIIGLVADMIGDSREAEWWDKANGRKNDGLYVGYRQDDFQSPGKVTKETYNVSSEIVQRFIRVLEKTDFLKPDDFLKIKKKP